MYFFMVILIVFVNVSCNQALICFNSCFLHLVLNREAALPYFWQHFTKKKAFQPIHNIIINIIYTYMIYLQFIYIVYKIVVANPFVCKSASKNLLYPFHNSTGRVSKNGLFLTTDTVVKDIDF